MDANVRGSGGSGGEFLMRSSFEYRSQIPILDKAVAKRFTVPDKAGGVLCSDAFVNACFVEST